jgi:hypothetical protein
MKKNAVFVLRLNLQRMLSQAWFCGSLATASLVASTLLLSVKADAQTPSPVNNNEINNYAQAVLTMESERQEAFDEIKKLMGGDIPKIVCNDARSINTLPPKAQEIATNYCKNSTKIVLDNGLSIDQFNKITLQLQNNNSLKDQVEKSLLRLQKQPQNP